MAPSEPHEPGARVRPMPFLEGERVTLQPIRREHAATYARWLNDPETRHYLDLQFPITISAEEKWIETRSAFTPQPTDVVFGVWTRADSRLIGNVGLHEINWIDRHAEVGYFLGDKTEWGKGYAPDAVRTLLRWTFRELDLYKVYIKLIAPNHRSRRVAEKLGLRQEGVLVGDKFRDGRHEDLLVYAAFQADWLDAGSPDSAD